VAPAAPLHCRTPPPPPPPPPPPLQPSLLLHALRIATKRLASNRAAALAALLARLGGGDAEGRDAAVGEAAELLARLAAQLEAEAAAPSLPEASPPPSPSLMGAKAAADDDGAVTLWRALGAARAAADAASAALFLCEQDAAAAAADAAATGGSSRARVALRIEERLVGAAARLGVDTREGLLGPVAEALRCFQRGVPATVPPSPSRGNAAACDPLQAEQQQQQQQQHEQPSSHGTVVPKRHPGRDHSDGTADVFVGVGTDGGTRRSASGPAPVGSSSGGGSSVGMLSELHSVLLARPKVAERLRAHPPHAGESDEANEQQQQQQQQPPPPPQQPQQAGSGGGLRHQTLERTAAPPARAPPRRSERRVPSWQGAGASPLTPLPAARPVLAAIANEAADQQAGVASPITPLGCCLPEEEQSSGDDEVWDDEARGAVLGAGSAENFLGELLTRLPARRQGVDRSSDEQVFASCD
jgi:hypothetical protein